SATDLRLNVIAPARLPTDRQLPSFPTRRSSDLLRGEHGEGRPVLGRLVIGEDDVRRIAAGTADHEPVQLRPHGHHLPVRAGDEEDRKSTRLNSSHVSISYAVFCLKKKKRAQATH